MFHEISYLKLKKALIIIRMNSHSLGLRNVRYYCITIYPIIVCIYSAIYHHCKLFSAIQVFLLCETILKLVISQPIFLVYA